MWKLDYKESWAPKNWCFWTVVLEKTLESPLDCKQIQQVNPKGNQSWVFIGKTAAEAEAPILWPSDFKNWLPWKRPWCWERLKAGGKGDNRGWDGWMASPTQWTWVWASSGSWWWTGSLVCSSESENHSVVSDSLGSHGLCPWNSLGQNTGVGSLSLLQVIFSNHDRTQAPALQADSLPVEPEEKPKNTGSM